jgi:hypothetical protein
MRYTILNTNSIDKLEMLVNAYLFEGWTLQGGVSVARDQGSYSYVQAMVK